MRADDDRYGWLDEETAERLLRGRTADGPSPADGPFPAAPTALEQVLDQLAAVRGAGTAAASAPGAHGDGELPGEAAALAAFRAARARSGATPAAGGARSPRAYVRTLARPLRVGIAGLAVCGVLGGVAVGASGGALPTPFGGGNDSPSSPTVSAEPGDGESVGRTTGGAGEPSGGSGDDGGPGGKSDDDGRRKSGQGPVGSDGSDGSADSAGSADSDGSGEAGGSGAGDGDGPAHPDGRLPVPEARLAVLCGEHVGDALDRSGRAELERLAGGPDRIDRLCRQVTDAVPTGGTGDGTSGGNGGSNRPGSPDDPPSGGTGGGGGEEGGDTVPDDAGRPGGGGGTEGGDALPDEDEESGPLPTDLPVAGSGGTSGGSGGANAGSGAPVTSPSTPGAVRASAGAPTL